MEENYYRQLVLRYLDRKASNDELEVFAHLMKQGKLDAYLAECMDEDAGLTEADLLLVKKPSRIIPLWLRYSVAATVLLVLSVTAYFFIAKEGRGAGFVAFKKDIAPGDNRAVLTLANGRTIILDTAGQGTLAHEGGAVIRKTRNGQVVYDLSAASADFNTGYNTISTPKGGQYEVVLPDGSHVWLNASSSIRFPATFTEKERRVEITGEAYFEVAKLLKTKNLRSAASQGERVPFIVEAEGQKVEVLGTHFNINAYKNEEAIRTTLLEGSVKVSKAKEAVLINPGEQAQVNPGGTISVVPANTESAVAWKNGMFSYKREDLRSVMRQIERWYDVDVQYEGKIPRTLFTGKVHRNVSLSQALEIISYLDVRFEIDGRTVIVKSE